MSFLTLLDRKGAGGFTPSDIPQSEADALIAFYNATGGASWTNNTNWLTDPVVNNWYGITVSGGHVTQISLATNNLVGAAENTLDPLASTLTVLQCNNNSITTLDVSALTSLTYLQCNSNSISTLDVSALTSLTYLRCNNNPISVLDVSALTSLTTLRCNNNSISVLDVSALTSLTYLRCNNNSISVLDVSALTSLTTLYCYSNSITVLAIDGITGLAGCQCQDNGMTQAQVDTIVQTIYDNWAAYTDATPELNIGGTNAAPSGVYQDGDPPTTGLEYIYEIANDPETTGNNTWVVTWNGGSAP